jgi:uncharacterized membrane protein
MIFKQIDQIALVIIICAAIGIFTSVALTVEEIHLLKDPQAALSCDLNPVVTCGDTILTDQAKAFGIPNPVIGIVLFSMLFAFGISLAAGAKYKRWFWRGLQAGATFGLLFSHWLIYQALYEIGSLCIYCMTTWVVVIALFVYVTFYNIERNHIKFTPTLDRAIRKVRAYKGSLILIWYLVIIGLILIRFWSYWSTLI